MVWTPRSGRALFVNGDLLHTRRCVNMKMLKLFINNEWVDSSDGKTFRSMDPSRNGVIAELSSASPEDVDKVVTAARKTFESRVWSDLDGDQCADYMLKAAGIMRRRLKEPAQWEAMDAGKPIMKAESVDLPYSICAPEYFAHQAREV
jgi:aldehyde dehydrogenase (NAD+)